MCLSVAKENSCGFLRRLSLTRSIVVFYRWEEGLKIFVGMVKASEEPWDADMGHPKPPTPDATTYGAAITACSRGKQWHMALRFLEDMEKKVRNGSILLLSREDGFVVCWSRGVGMMLLAESTAEEGETQEVPGAVRVTGYKTWRKSDAEQGFDCCYCALRE